MRMYLFVLLILSISINCFAQQNQSRFVVLISIDGLLPEFYLDKSWPMPTLQQLHNDNSRAKQMRSVFPSYTYPSHAAMLTGALPARTGISYNAVPGSEDWYWFTKDIRSQTLWQALKQQGLTTAAVEWPISMSYDITYNIPEIWNTKTPGDRITETRKYATKGLVEEIEKNATGRLDSSNMNEEHLGLDDNAGRMAAYIFKKYRPNLLAVHLVGADGKQHEHGRGHEKIKKALANIDNAIAHILETIEQTGLKDSTTVLIVGDHGMTTMHTVIRPNVLLSKRDLLTKAKFQPAGGSAFLYLNNKADLETLQKVRDVLENSAEQQYFFIYDRKKLDSLGVDSNAVMALAAKPGYVFSGSSTGEVTGSTSGGHHGYDPSFPEMMTGFIAAGAGVNKGVIIQDMCVTDIAPIITALLGVRFNAPDGRVPAGLLRTE